MTHPTPLQQRLEQYANTTHGQPGRSFNEIAGYAAAVGAGLAMAGGAEAGILYSGAQNLSVSINPAAQATNLAPFPNVAMHALDMDGGGVDFQAGVVQYGLLANSGTAAKYWGVAGLQGQGGAAALGAGSLAANLAGGALVGPAGNFVNNGFLHGGVQHGGLTVIQNTYSGGNFAAGATGFAGIRLASGNYGWIRLKWEDMGVNQPFSTVLGGSPLLSGTGFADRLTILDWAYDDSGAAIRAGDTGASIPEPSSLALLAAGAAGLAALRRRRKSH